MSNFGAETTARPNGYREPGPREPAAQSETPRTDGGDQGPQRARGADRERGINFQQIMNFAREMGGKVKQVPYIVPIAAGAAGFVVGALVSSKILRQVCLFAGSYALKEAVRAAPRDEILGYAKRFLVDAIERQRAV